MNPMQPPRNLTHPDFQRLMSEATRLTRSGDLQAATAAIQAALGGGGTGWPAAAATFTAAPGVIDVEAREVPERKPELLQAPPDDKAVPADNRAPPPARFIAGGHSDPAAGRRDYKLFIPSAAGQRPLPLVVMLHGCTQHPDDFAAGTAMIEAAQAQGFFVLYPAQSQ